MDKIKKFKISAFIRKLMDSNKKLEEIESSLREKGVYIDNIDEKIINSIAEKVSQKEIEKFKKEFSKFEKSVIDRDIVDIKYLVKEVNILRLALISDKTRGKLKYISGQMEVICRDRNIPFEDALKFQEESEIRKFGFLDQINYQEAEIKRLRGIIRDLKCKLFGKKVQKSKDDLEYRMEVSCVKESVLEDEEYEGSKTELLSKISFQESEIERLKDIVGELKSKLFVKDFGKESKK